MAFDRNALALDTAAGRAAWDTTRALMVRVSGYQSGLEALRLGPVAVFDTTIDPLASMPGLKQSLLDARAHADGWRSIGNELYLVLMIGVLGFAQSLTAYSAEIHRIVDGASSPKRALTDDERTRILGALRALEGILESDKSKIEAVKPRLTEFIRLITADFAPLTSGAQKIDDAATAIDQATYNAAMKYMSDPPIMNMVLELGRKLSGEYRVISPAVHALAGANDDSQKAVRDLLAVWTTVVVKFKSVITTLTTAEKSIATFEDLPLLLEIAESSWNDLAEYLKKSA